MARRPCRGQTLPAGAVRRLLADRMASEPWGELPGLFTIHQAGGELTMRRVQLARPAWEGGYPWQAIGRLARSPGSSLGGHQPGELRGAALLLDDQAVLYPLRAAGPGQPPPPRFQASARTMVAVDVSGACHMVIQSFGAAPRPQEALLGPGHEVPSALSAMLAALAPGTGRDAAAAPDGPGIG